MCYSFQEEESHYKKVFSFVLGSAISLSNLDLLPMSLKDNRKWDAGGSGFERKFLCPLISPPVNSAELLFLISSS